ncbi:MAG: TerB family tellurite resistance protein [Planctomycetota bacterium]
MDQQVAESVLALCLFAAMADGRKDEAEREHIRSIMDSLDAEHIDDLDHAGIYRRVLMGGTSIEAEAAKLAEPGPRHFAYEMATAVCDADGQATDAERTFLGRLATALQLESSDASAVLAQADEVAAIPLVDADEEPIPVPLTDAGLEVQDDAIAREVDGMVLRYAILNGALELLPQGIATLAILPLQTKMVYRVGKKYGYTLDRGHIKEFIGVVGVGMTSQVVENVARDLVGKLAKRMLGKTAGTIAKAATGPMMSFASTWALGQVGRMYYAGGRTLSAVDLKGLFGREVERGKALYQQHRGEVEATASKTDASQVLALARGKASV